MYRQMNLRGLGISLTPSDNLTQLVKQTGGAVTAIDTLLNQLKHPEAVQPAPTTTLQIPNQVPSWVVPVGLAMVALAFFGPRLRKA